MIVLRDSIHPEGAARAPTITPPLVPVVRPPPAAGTSVADRLLGASIFANQAYFYAQCSAADAVGSCVYANSTQAFVSTADHRSPDPVIGIIVSKQSPTNCTVQRFGQSSVSFTGLQAGKRYFLGLKGTLLAPPFDDEMPEYAQQVGNAVSDTLLFIQPTGQVIRRIVRTDFVLNAGPSEPVNNGKYDRQNVYIDRVAMAAYTSPAMSGEDSVILVGDGPPSATQDNDAQAVYRSAAGDLYFADGSGSVPPDVSALIFGQGAPTGSETPSNNVFFLNTNTLAVYPRATTSGTT